MTEGTIDGPCAALPSDVLDLPLALLAEAFGQAGMSVDDEAGTGQDALPAAPVAALVLAAEGGTGPAARV